MTEQSNERTKAQQYNFNKLQKRIRRNTGNAIRDFNMIEEGDRIIAVPYNHQTQPTKREGRR